MVMGMGMEVGRGAGPLSDGELDADLALGTAGRAAELEGSDGRGRAVDAAADCEGVGVEEVLDGGSGGADKGLGGLGGLGMEDVEGEEKKGFGRGEGDGKREALVPDGASGAGVVGLGGDAAVGIEVGHNVGLEVAVSPIDVLEVLRGDDGDLEVQGPRRWRWRRRALRGVHGFRWVDHLRWIGRAEMIDDTHQQGGAFGGGNQWTRTKPIKVVPRR